MGYKNETYYEFMNSLDYKNGVFHEKGKVYGTLKEELEKAYNEGMKAGVPKKSIGSIILDGIAIICGLVILLAVYTGVLILLWKYF